MGFLSAWDETQRIDVSDLAGAPEGTWWVDIKKCLTHEEANTVMRKLMRSTLEVGETTQRGVAVKTKLSTDAVVDHQDDLVLMSIVNWNLTDRNGNLLPYAPREALQHSLGDIPSTVYDRISKVVMDANTEKSEEASSFLDGGEGSDQAGENYSPDDSEVLV
jgi:predicted glycosyl hydrolase (DUF1957 family)